jgi:hypothetical protein
MGLPLKLLHDFLPWRAATTGQEELYNRQAMGWEFASRRALPASCQARPTSRHHTTKTSTTPPTSSSPPVMAMRIREASMTKIPPLDWHRLSSPPFPPSTVALPPSSSTGTLLPPLNRRRCWALSYFDARDGLEKGSADSKRLSSSRSCCWCCCCIRVDEDSVMVVAVPPRWKAMQHCCCCCCCW